MKTQGICATCTKGPRTLSYRLPKGLSCSTCYQARKYGRVQRITGATCACGCGRPARGISGYAHHCYVALWRRTRFFQTVTGTKVSLATVAEVLRRLRLTRFPPIQAESLRAATALVQAVVEGAVTLQRKPSYYRRSARGFTGWKKRSHNRKSPLRMVG